jgi:hypothetical protein
MKQKWRLLEIPDSDVKGGMSTSNNHKQLGIAW